jgi:thiamine kinase-like enzyme
MIAGGMQSPMTLAPPWFTREELTPAFLEAPLRRALADPTLAVSSVEVIDPGGASVIKRTQLRLRKFIGMYALRVAVDGNGGPRTLDLWLKSKALDEECKLTLRTGMLSSPRLLRAWRRYNWCIDFTGSHEREPSIYELHAHEPRFTRITPRVHHLLRDDERETYVLVFEKFGPEMELLDTIGDVSGWRREHLEIVLSDLAEFHAIWLGREAELRAQPWIEPVPDAAMLAETRELWDAIACHLADILPSLYTPERLALQREHVRTVSDWAPRLDALPRTLVHGDVTPRNLCLRRLDNKLRLCLYDWELSTLNVPQHDLAQFLCYTLTPEVERTEVDHFVALHRAALERASGRALDEKSWREGYALELRDVLFRKIPFIMMSRAFRQTPAAARVFHTAHRLLAFEQ